MNALNVGDFLLRPKLPGVIHVGVWMGSGAVFHNTPDRGEHISSVADFCHRSLENQPPRVTKKPATPECGEQKALLFQQAPYQPLGMEFVGKEVRVT